jgi:D-alanine-D-alanine ligase
MARVAVLKGGPSLERQVSLRSGARVEDALERLGHDVIGIDVGGDLIPRLREAGPDVAFVAMHGRDGEDGTVQELLEILDIPYTGSGVLACVRCMDKVLAKNLMLEAGLPTPEFFAFNDTAFNELGAAEALGEIGERLGYPIVVKPAGQGSALGIKFAPSPEALPAAIVAALSYDTKVLLERHVRGRELAVSILDGPDGPEPLPIVEAIPRERDFYDFEARYEFGRTNFRCPADVDDDVAEAAGSAALATYELLGCAGFARIDLILDEDSGAPTVLEANAIPGLTETSLMPQAADAAGIGLDELVSRILEQALARTART